MLCAAQSARIGIMLAMDGISHVPWGVGVCDAASSTSFHDQGRKLKPHSSSRGQCICSGLSTQANRPARVTSRQASKHCLLHCISFASVTTICRQHALCLSPAGVLTIPTGPAGGGYYDDGRGGGSRGPYQDSGGGRGGYQDNYYQGGPRGGGGGGGSRGRGRYNWGRECQTVLQLAVRNVAVRQRQSGMQAGDMAVQGASSFTAAAAGMAGVSKLATFPATCSRVCCSQHTSKSLCSRLNATAFRLVAACAVCSSVRRRACCLFVLLPERLFLRCVWRAGGGGRSGPPPAQRRRDTLPDDITELTELKKHEKVCRSFC